MACDILALCERLRVFADSEHSSELGSGLRTCCGQAASALERLAKELALERARVTALVNDADVAEVALAESRAGRWKYVAKRLWDQLREQRKPSIRLSNGAMIDRQAIRCAISQDFSVGNDVASELPIQLERAESALSQMREERDRLRAALERVEWVDDVSAESHICPWCWRWKPDGHASDCPRQIALGRTGDAQ